MFRNLAILLLVLAILVVLTIFFLMPHVRHSVVATNTNVTTNTDTPAIWMPGIEEQFNSSPVPVDKLWVKNFAEFVNSNPTGNWILARSQTSCTSEDEARKEAINDACSKITALLGENHPNLSVEITKNITPAAIGKCSFIVDRFAQAFRGSAGAIWREALLIDAAPDKLAQLRAHQQVVFVSKRTHWLRTIFSIAGIMVVICVIYLFLNAATRGYYVWALRLAALVLVVAGVILVLRWI